jgi:hypothetical protein
MSWMAGGKVAAGAQLQTASWIRVFQRSLACCADGNAATVLCSLSHMRQAAFFIFRSFDGGLFGYRAFLGLPCIAGQSPSNKDIWTKFASFAIGH